MSRAWTIVARCIDCGSKFERRVVEEWRIRCVPCWRANRAVVPAPVRNPLRGKIGRPS